MDSWTMNSFCVFHPKYEREKESTPSRGKKPSFHIVSNVVDKREKGQVKLGLLLTVV